MVSRRQILANAGRVCLLGAIKPSRVIAQNGLMQRAIPKTGELLPVIGLGTYRTFNVGDDPSELDPLKRVTDSEHQPDGRVTKKNGRFTD